MQSIKHTQEKVNKTNFVLHNEDSDVILYIKNLNKQKLFRIIKRILEYSQFS